MTLLPRLASQIFNRAHFITPGAAEAVLTALAGRIGDYETNNFAGENVFDDRSGAWKGYRITKGGVAIVPIIGELVNRGAWLGARSGVISYEGLRHSLRQAAADSRVRALVLDIDSPGGMASGMFETADLVRQIAARKQVTAVANSMAASAAYGIASGAGRIVVTETSQVGSIGVLYIHADRSGELAKRGVKMTIIHAGARKADGHPFAPLPEAVRADIQAHVDGLHGAFIAMVLQGRRNLSEQRIRDTEARIYMGREAVDVGLADEVGTFDGAVTHAESGHRGLAQTTDNPPQQAAAAARWTRNGDAMCAAVAGGGQLTTDAIGMVPIGTHYSEANKMILSARAQHFHANPVEPARPEKAVKPPRSSMRERHHSSFHSGYALRGPSEPSQSMAASMQRMISARPPNHRRARTEPDREHRPGPAGTPPTPSESLAASMDRLVANMKRAKAQGR